MSTFEEYAVASVEHLRSVEALRQPIDDKILDTEAKLLRITSIIKEEFRSKQQENASLRGSIQQLKSRADEVEASLNELRRTHAQEKAKQEQMLEQQTKTLENASVQFRSNLQRRNSNASAIAYQRRVSEMRQRVAEIQQESLAKAQLIKDDIARNDLQLLLDNQSLSSLKSQLEVLLAEGPVIEKQITQTQSRNAAFEKRSNLLSSAIAEAERIEEEARQRERERLEKEKAERERLQPKSPAIGRNAFNRATSIANNLTYDVYMRELSAPLSPSITPLSVTPVTPLSPVSPVSPLSPQTPLSPSESHVDIFDDLINETLSPKPRRNSTIDSPKASSMWDLKVVLPNKEFLTVTWNHFTDNVAMVKKSVYQILFDKNMWPVSEARTIDEYVFKTAEDSFVLDELVLLKSTPYLVYCMRKRIAPELQLVERKLHRNFLNQVSTILGDVPLAEGGQANYFRDEMVGLLEEIGRIRKENLDENWKNRIEEAKEDIDLDLIRRRGSTASMLLSRSMMMKSPDMKNSSSNLRSPPESPHSLTPERSNSILANISSPDNLRREMSIRDMSIRGELGIRDSPDMVRRHSGENKNRNSNDFTKYVPAEASTLCTIRLFLSGEISKTFTCEESATIGDVLNVIYAKYLKDLSFIHKTDEISFSDFKKQFVLKPRGRDDYLLMQKSRLHEVEYINHMIRRKKKIILILVNISDKKTEEFDAYMETYTNANGEPANEVFEEFGRPTEGPEYIPIWKVSKPLRVKIGGVKNMPLVDEPTAFRLYVTVALYQQGDLINPAVSSKQVVFSPNPSWLAWLDIIPYNNIPWGAIMHMRVYLVNTKSKTVADQLIGWVNHRLLDYKDCINSGFFSVKMWLASSVKENPAAIPQQNDDPNAPVITFEIEMSRPVPFFSDMQAADFAELGLNNLDEEKIKETTDRATVDKVIATDPLYKPTPEQSAILWRNRYYCKQRPKSIAKLLAAVPWKESTCVYEIYAMLDTWAPLGPAESLELFNPKFVDRQIRRFAIKNLKRMGDVELSNYLLQMVQALKHETNHDSPLAHFLLRRALMNRLQIGHPFFWQLKAELQASARQTEWGERFALVLEAFLRGCGTSLREDFFNQYDVYTKLKSASLVIKPLAHLNRREALKGHLATITLPSNGFPLPTNPSLRGKQFDLEKVKSMQSKTAPLWLVFSNYDPFGDLVLSMFKAGDDLRQDQLTLQMIRIMDKMWYDAGIDLQTTYYKCVSTGPDEGWIEIVTESVTIADIQKGKGGITAAFSEDAIANWLREKNPAEWEYAAAVENFIHSCASSCVATYLLGIGDRHNDNIMIQKSGHLFHIDFGRFLGNYQTWNGIKRERAPFVFTPSFAYVMGGADHPNFKRFVDLCGRAYNTLRKNAHIFLNLFMMMIGTGLPELTCAEDINYLRDAFKLDKNDEQAAEGFSHKITKSMNSKATELNFAVHIMANPN